MAAKLMARSVEASIVIRTAGYRFTWHGGEYIHVADDDGHLDPQPYGVINVWDYGRGQARIPVSIQSMMDEVLQYIAQDREDQQ